jgi:D-alanyl-D-alanine carboxypeptidase
MKTLKTIWHHTTATVLAVGIPVGGFALGVFLVVFATDTTPTAYAPRVSLDPAAIMGKAALVYDPGTRVLWWQKSANEELPLASLTKLMTAQVVLNQKSPATAVTITARDLKPEGDWGFKVGQVIPLGDLLRFGLTVSSNDALAAAAATIGPDYVAQMNAEADRLGLTHTHFLNPTGLDMTQSIAGAYGSAYDVARLVAVFYQDHPDYLKMTTAQTSTLTTTSGDLVAVATAAPLSDVPGFIGGKTGFTDLAGGNLAIVFDVEPGHPLVAVVLGSTEAGRFDDIKTLINAARSAQ